MSFGEGLLCVEQAIVKFVSGTSERGIFHVLWPVDAFWVRGQCKGNCQLISDGRRWVAEG